MGVADSFRRNWRVWLMFVTPFLLSPLLIKSESQSSKCAFMLGVCTVFWVTESLPLPLTSLLPLVMAPVLGVLNTDDACQAFFGNLSALIIGALFVGIAVEDSNLHRRIALFTLLSIGVQPKRLLFSVMAITGFLSMWIANTAATSMMTPIVSVLMEKLIEARKKIVVTHDLEHEQETEMLDWKSESKMEDQSLENDKGLGSDDAINDMDNSRVKSMDHGIGKDDIHKVHETDGHFDIPSNNAVLQCEDGINLLNEPSGKKDRGDVENNRTVKYFFLAICYSANIGGIGTLLGTPPNVVLANAVKDLTQDESNPITYVSWMKFGIPVSMVTMTVAYFWLSACLFGIKKTFLCQSVDDEKETRLLRKVLQKEFQDLGTMTFHEKVVLGHFVVLILLFLSRDPGFAQGFATLFPPKYISDAVGAMAVGISLFIWPRCRPNVLCFRKSQDTSQPESQQPALTWKKASKSMHWGLIFLFGGGMVLAKATKMSGLSNEIGEYLTFVSNLPTWVTVLVLSTLVCGVTEITSNTVIAIIILPIVGNLALRLQVNPLLYMLPVAVSTSMAFMLPVATPPNAIIYSMGGVKMTDMIKTGLAMNLLGIFSINLVLNTVAYYAFSLGEFPLWAGSTNDVIGNVTSTTMNSSTYDVIGNVTMVMNESILA